MMDFMDSLRRGVDRAGFELDRLLRANRVRAQIGGLRSQVDEELRQIGLGVVELYQRGEPIPEGLGDRCERVKQIQEEIAQKETELEAINREAPPAQQEPYAEPTAGTVTCPNCGAVVPEDAAFCPRCGVRLKPEAPQTPPPEQPAP